MSEVLWEEKRGAIDLIAVRTDNIVQIRAGVIALATRSFSEREYHMFDPVLIGDIKRNLIEQIAHACVELANDIRG